jgi:putative ABC transport system substrate-binding protein
MSGIGRRAVLAGALAGGAAAATGPIRPSRAQGQARRRVTMVLFRGETEVEQGFRAHVLERGLPFDITVLNINRQSSRLPEFVEEIRRTRPDLVYTWGTTVTLGIAGAMDADPATRIPPEIPVVFALVADPVGARIAPAMGEPSGRNLTGVSHIVPLPSQIAAIRAYRPFDRLGVIFNPQERNSQLNVDGLQALSGEEGFELVALPVPPGPDGQPDPAAVIPLVDQVADRGADFLYMGPDTFVGDQRFAITARALFRGIPTFSATELEVRTSQTLFGLVSRYDNVGRFAAHKAERILVEGVPAAAIAVETLPRFSYIVNIGVAKALELYPPMSVLRFAEVIGA